MKRLFLAVLFSLPWASFSRAADPAPDGVVHIDHTKVTYDKGAKLLENGEFKVLTSHRDGPGKAEIHAHDTDIFLIIDGTADFVTGGSVVDLKTRANGESSGKEITGGETHHLVKGDVIVIPRGVPHWFKQVNGPFLYYVVKVTK
jgi:mannose-6-phosphate isomerase-like protein (cupin superfamily)